MCIRDRVKEEIEEVSGIDADDAPLISAKRGINVEEVLEQIITKIPAPVSYTHLDVYKRQDRSQR